MAELSADILLRPTRIGFLTRPTDLRSVRTIMRACTCVWGGVFNPIIPVFKRPPKEWKPEVYERFRGTEVAKGYVRFFEPDVFVETTHGLLEEAGLRALRKDHTAHPQVATLKGFLESENSRDWSEPGFGLNIHDVLAHIYETAQQFVHRDERECLHVMPVKGNALTEAMFGAYPASSDLQYIEQAYVDVYRPEKAEANPDTWRRVFLKGAVTPLRVTGHGLDTRRQWNHDPLIYVFDPARVTDLLDLWNLRLEPHPVLPVPVGWFETLGDDIFRILKAEHRPVVGNPHGVMHHATIEFARSIPKASAEAIIRTLKPGLPKGALVVKVWRNAIWVEHHDDRMHRDERVKVVAKEQRAILALKEGGDLRTTFTTVEPEFPERFGRGVYRCVNVLTLSNYSNRNVATILPFNTFDRRWPPLADRGEQIPVGSEGWVFPHSFNGLAQHVFLLDANDAIVGWLDHLGIKAGLSEPGYIARQMLEQLGGLWGVHLLSDAATLELLNRMAGGLRRWSNDKETTEEYFGLRTATLAEWTKLVSTLQARHSLPYKGLDAFTKRNIIRLGIETDCPHCKAKNWSTLTDVDYRINCERCLKPYDFPQAALRPKNGNLTYRVTGPFSVPDYGKGSYSALLTLRFLDQFHSAASTGMTFSTAMNLSFDRIRCEVDFIAWRGEDRMRENRRPPRLIIGETKSFGKGDLVKAHDLAQLKALATKLPDAVVVISVLRDHFTRTERKMLARFVNWGRRVNVHGEPTNPVLLLTLHELTMDHLLSTTWKRLGGTHAKFADQEQPRNLLNLADATQQIYLGMSSFYQVRDEYWKRRMTRRKATQDATMRPIGP